MHKEPFVLLKNYRQEQKATKLKQNVKPLQVVKKVTKRTQKQRKILVEQEREPQQPQFPLQQGQGSQIQLQQYQEDAFDQAQYSPLQFHEIPLNYYDCFNNDFDLIDENYGF